MRPRTCLPLIALLAAFLPATSSPPPAYAGPAKHAPKKTEKDRPPAPIVEEPPAPVAEVPWVNYQSTRQGVVAHIHLAPLPADAASIVFVAEKLPPGGGEAGNLVPIACDGAKVIHEVDSAIFAEAPRRGVEISLPVLLGAPELEPSKLYAVRACMRDTSGALHGGDGTLGTVMTYPTTASELDTIETPSGPVGPSTLQKGLAVLGYDVKKAAEVIEHVHKLDARAGIHVSIEVEGIGEIASTRARSYYVPAKQDFVLVGSLRAGDEIFVRGGGTARVTRASLPNEDLGATSLTVDGEGDFFIHDLLAKDAAPAKGDASAFSDDTTNTWVADSESYDCQLSSTLAVRALPSDAKSVVLVVKKQRKHAGERTELSCDQGSVVIELPKKIIEMAKTTSGLDGGPGAWLGIAAGDEDEKSPIACETGYSMLACYRGADGSLSPLGSSKARYGLAGSSCFVAGTPISTPEGDTAIESLVPGARIYGYDVEGHRLGTVHVEHVTPRTKYDIGTVVLSNGTELRVTSEHPFFVRGLGFVMARDLETGDRLLQADGSDVRVERMEAFDGEGEVYDVSVDGPHDYFAGGVLVHNY